MYNDIDAVKKLLAEGTDVNEVAISGPAEGYTCLMMASRNKRPDLVEFLIEHGADINIKEGDGETALSLAEKEDDIEMMKL
jgi:ankyrin repeat protein